ncbi:O-methyltransferase [Paenibacillus sabuli]|nr:O-methyltransferase [Paenibacillus sabuli]
MEGMPLARQVDMVFRKLEEELTDAVAGTVSICIRNNSIGKFGVRHNPIESRDGHLEEAAKGMSAAQVRAFRQMAIDALKLKRNWTHGEIVYDFSVRSGGSGWSASVQYESNYNSSSWIYRNPGTGEASHRSYRGFK